MKLAGKRLSLPEATAALARPLPALSSLKARKVAITGRDQQTLNEAVADWD